MCNEKSPFGLGMFEMLMVFKWIDLGYDDDDDDDATTLHGNAALHVVKQSPLTTLWKIFTTTAR